MLEKRKIQCRRYNARICFPVMDYLGNFIVSDRRYLTARRENNVFVDHLDDVDLPTMFLDIKKPSRLLPMITDEMRLPRK